MHELSIAISILDSVEEEMNERGCGPIEAIHVRIGMISGVVPEALQSAYELAAAQTSLPRSRLVIEQIPVVIYCATCKCERQAASPEWFCCPECRTVSTQLVSGRELEISALELST